MSLSLLNLILCLFVVYRAKFTAFFHKIIPIVYTRDTSLFVSIVIWKSFQVVVCIFASNSDIFVLLVLNNSAINTACTYIFRIFHIFINHRCIY